MKAKKILKGIALALIFSTGLLTSCSKENATNKVLDRMAMEGNRLCPMDVDNMTRWDSITHPASLTLAYYHTVAATKADLDWMQLDWNQVKGMLISNLKSNPRTASLLDLNIKFRYFYFDSEGQEVYRTEILPVDYKINE